MLFLDEKAQIGRVASAHSGQRLSFLLVALATLAALTLFRAAKENGDLSETISSWFDERSQHIDPVHALPLLFQSFQDDLFEVAVGEAMEHIIEQVEHETIKGLYGVEMSEKREANLPFSSTFEFIGAHFDTSDPAHILRRPADHILSALDVDITWLAGKRKALASRKRAKERVGRLAFCARFVRHG